MNNNLDSKLQRPLESSPERLSKASLKALGNATPAQGTAQTAPRPALNRPATTQYLNQIAHEQDEVGEALARSINRVNQGLSQASYAPDDADAPVDAQSKSMAVYTKLAGKLIDRDQGLQNRVAHNLSESNHPIKAKDAAHSLQQAMERLPERLQEGTTSGKELAKFMVQNLVQLADTKNMGAGLERDLAMRQISVPQHQVSPRMQQANAKVLAASINYIKQNQPEVLDQLTKQPQPEPKPSAQSQQQPTHQPAPQQAQSTISDAELEGKTYLDIFKQRSAQGVNQGIPFAPQGKGGAYDRMSAEISQRIHELITKAASNAKSGNLIRLSPEEAENFDRTVSAARERAQGEHGTRLQSMLDRATTDQQKARAAQGPDGTLPPSTTTKATQAEAVRGLSLSELSARAAKLQQQFREERQRIVSEGKLPNPAQLPETKFDAPKAAASPPTPESQARQQALSNVENNTRQLMAALAQAKAALASKIAQGVPPDAIEQEGTIPTKPEVVATKAAEPSAKAPAQPSSEPKPAPETKPAEAKPTEAKPTDAKSVEAKPVEAKPTEAKPTPAPAAESAKPLDLSLLKNTTLNVSYQAVQSTLYGDLDVMPGMTIPVSHFGDLQNEVITPNDKAIEILKAQARVLAAQQQAQASNNLTELVASTKTAAQPNQAQAAAQQILSQQSQQPAQPTPAQPAPQVVTSGPQQAAAQIAQPAQAAAQQLQAQQTPTQQAAQQPAQQPAQAAPQVVTSGPQQAAAQVAEQAQATAQQLQAQQTPTQQAAPQPAQAAPQVVTSGPQQAAAQVAAEAQAAAQQLQAQQTPAQQTPAQQPAQSAPQVVTSGPQQAAAQVAEQAQATAQQLQTQQTPAQSAPQVVTSGPQQAAAQVAAEAQAAAQQLQAQQTPAQQTTAQPVSQQPAQAAPQVVTSGPQQAAAQVAEQAQAAAQQLQAQQTPAQQTPAQQPAQSAPQVVTSGPQQAAAQVAAEAQAAAQQLQAQQTPAQQTTAQPASQQPAQSASQVVISGLQQAAAQVAEQAQAAAQQLQAQQTPTQQASQQSAQQPAQAAPQVVTSGPQQTAAQVAAEAQAAAQQLQAQQTPAQQAAQQPAQSAPQVVTSGPQQAAAQAQAAAQQLQAQQTPAQPASQQPAQSAPQVVTSGPQQAAAQVAEQAQAAAQQLQAQQTPAQPASQQPAQSAPQVVTSGPQQAAAQVAAEAQAAAQQLQAQQTPALQASQQSAQQPALQAQQTPAQPASPQPAQSAPQVVTSGPQQAAAQVAAEAQAAAQQLQAQQTPTLPTAAQVAAEPEVVTSGPQQAAAPVAEETRAAAPAPATSAEPVRSVGARYARLYGQMQTGNYDEAQIKHPTNDVLHDKAAAEQLRSDQSVVLSTLSKLEQIIAKRQHSELAARSPTQTVAEVSARLNAGTAAAPLYEGEAKPTKSPDPGLLHATRPTSAPQSEADPALNEESAKIAAATERVRAQSLERSEPPAPTASHASVTDVKQTREFLAAQAQEQRIAQDQAQQKEQAQQAAAKLIAQQEQEQEQLERKAIAQALELEQVQAETEQALNQQQLTQEQAAAISAHTAQQANSAPVNSVTGAPSLLASQGSSILNPSAPNKVGTASDFNRLYREAMQSEAQQRTQHYADLDQTRQEQQVKAARDTVTLTQQRAAEAQALGSSQVNTVGDTNIRATGATIASATTNLTEPRLAQSATTQGATAQTVAPTPSAQGQAAPSTATSQGTASAQAMPSSAATTASALPAGATASAQAAPNVGSAPMPNAATNLTGTMPQGASPRADSAALGTASNVKVGALGGVSATAPTTDVSGMPASGVSGTAAASAAAPAAGTAQGNAASANLGAATTLGLDEESLQDEIIKNVMRTVPSDDLDEFNLRSGQPLSGVIADTDLTAEPSVSAMPQAPSSSFSALNPSPEAVVPRERTAGAAGVSVGQNAPIPEQSVVKSYEAPAEGGLLRRLASLFGRSSAPSAPAETPEIAQGQSASVVASTVDGLKRAASREDQPSTLRANSLDQMVARLTQAAGDSSLPAPMQQQARKLMAALENPVSDLHTVSNWLNFVTGPLAPSSSQALALHQWAFMLLCIRFEQIGRNVDKFLKQQGKVAAGNAPDLLEELEPALREAKDVANSLRSSKGDSSARISSQLLDDTMGQIERLQHNMQLIAPDQVLPRAIPLPPFYRGGKEGSLSARRETEDDGSKSWHLDFNFDLENLGPLEVKVKLHFPDVQMSFIVERLETLQKVQSLMPELNQHLAQMGLHAKGSNARLGHITPPVTTSPDLGSHSGFRYEGSSFTTNA